MAAIQDRVALLSHAIDLCESLAAVLNVLGPKHCSEIPQSDGPSVRQEQIRLLEDTLGQAFRAAIEARNQVLAPVYRVTDDVLQLLLLHSLEDSPPTSREFFGPPMRTPYHWPYILSSVSRRWRDVALRTAPLWSRILISAYEIPSPHTNEAGRSHPRFKTVPQVDVGTKRRQLSLTRSKGAPLAVGIDAWLSRSGTNHIIPFFAANCTNRVQNLTINIRTYPPPPSQAEASAALQVLTQCIQSNSATLMNLTIGHPSIRPDAENQEALYALFSTELPRLRQAHFSGLPFKQPAPQFAIFASCRVLNLDCTPEQYFSWESCRALFATCGQLEDVSLVLHRYKEVVNLSASSSQVSMSRLRRFEITYNDCDHIDFPFPMLALPNLRTLQVRRSHLPNPQQMQASLPDTLPDALMRAILNSSLVVSFSVGNILPAVLRQLIPHLAAVRELSILYTSPEPSRSRDLHTEVLATLVEEEAVSMSFFLPALMILDLRTPATMDTLSFMYDLLGKRKAAGLPIQSLRLRQFSDTSTAATQPTPEEAYAAEEKVASLVDSFYIEQGNWYFDRTEREWKQRA